MVQVMHVSLLMPLTADGCPAMYVDTVVVLAHLTFKEWCIASLMPSVAAELPNT
jgi:hypothetical protein